MGPRPRTFRVSVLSCLSLARRLALLKVVAEDHAGGGALGYRRGYQEHDLRQGGYPSAAAAVGLRRKTARYERSPPSVFALLRLPSQALAATVLQAHFYSPSYQRARSADPSPVENHSLADYNISHQSTVHLILSLRDNVRCACFSVSGRS